jgi:glycosyltransferase involved in cell wall biosynthesis
MTKLKVAVIAPPWLALPVKGYGGIELVLEGLIQGLKDQGVTVEVFANGARAMKGVKTHSLYKTEQFSEIHKPYYESASIVQAHLQFSLDRIRKDGSFDIIHDHNTLIGPQFLAMATQLPGMPPALHTFHGPPFSTDDTIDKGIPNNRLQLEQLHDMGRMYMVAISEAMSKMAPRQIKPHLLPAVHNAIQLNDFPFVSHKKDYFITLARFNPDKGQHTAVKLAVKLNKRLRMAGTIAGIGSNRRLLLELSNPLSSYRSNQEFRYYSDKILPAVLHHRKISYVGNLSGVRKMTFISQAKALLFPIDWEEPFGMAVIEALACGTPVIAMNRGAMPEIVEHGVTGFLANNEKEFEEYMLRVDEIDPAACRRSIEEKFSSGTMALNYIERYNEVIKRTSSKVKK